MNDEAMVAAILACGHWVKVEVHEVGGLLVMLAQLERERRNAEQSI